MKQILTLMVTMLCATAFSQSVIVAESFPTNEFNSSGYGSQSGGYNGNITGWALTSSASSVVEVDDAPSGGSTKALRFSSAGGGSNNPRNSMATSPNLNLGIGTCSVSSVEFQFSWYVSSGAGNDYNVMIEFSGNGGSSWSTAWSNNNLPSSGSWRSASVAIPNSNSYWSGSDFRFRLSATRSSGSTTRDIWFDNIRIFAISAGPDIPSFTGLPVLVQGTDLQPGAVYLYQDVMTSPAVFDALIKIVADSNAHVTTWDADATNASHFQPKIANDGSLGNGSETSDRGWVHFSIVYIADNSYQENNPATDADDSYTPQSLNGLRYQHYDLDGFANGSGTGAGYFREVVAVANTNTVLMSNPTNLTDGGSYVAGGYTWKKVLGEIGEHTAVSADPEVSFISTYGAVPSIEIRVGFEFAKGNGGSTSVDREYGTNFTCLTFAQQSSTLPVTLVSFTGVYKNGSAILNWLTEAESNFDRFEIERSSNNTSFAGIGTKQGIGEGNRQAYQYADDLSAEAGSVFYYRLKMVDRDGQFKYSNVILLRKETKAINGIAINPNPVVGGMATVRFTAPSAGSAQFNVVDMSGKTVLKQQATIYNGNNSISINNLGRLQPGVYLLQMVMGEEMTTVKFNIAR